MLEKTIDVIGSVVEIDQTMTEETRRGFMEMVRSFKDGKTKDDSPAPAVCVVYAEAAKRLGCSKDMVRYLRRKGKLVGVTYGGTNHHGVTEESLNAFINRNRRAGAVA